MRARVSASQARSLEPATVGATRTSLSPSQRQFLSLLQEIRFGRVHRLAIRCGQPDLRDDVRWTRTVKVLGENCPHPCAGADDFHLRREVVEFFRLLSAIGEGEITDIEIRNGLPFTFEVSGTALANTPAK